MTVDLPLDLLQRSPQEGARLVVLQRLAAAATAAGRLADPADAEALHDFRVGVRRTRSALRAYRPVLDDAVSKKLRRRLRDLMASTNADRDREVQIAWLEAQLPRLQPAGRRGARWLADSLRGDDPDAPARTARRAAAEFVRLERALRRRLSSLRIELAVEPGAEPSARPTFGTQTGELVAAHGAELRATLAEVHETSDEAAAHAARIAAKRLRYLLEPLRELRPEAADLVDRLRELQDLLGELHDAHVLGATLADALAAAAAERARARAATALAAGSEAARGLGRRGSPASGALALADLLRARQTELFARVDEVWLGGRGDAFLRQVERFADRLAAGTKEEG